MTDIIDFGRDTSCTTSLRTGRFVSGVRLVAEAAYRRLTTRRGLLRGGEEEANYGIDLCDLIGSVKTKTDEASLPGRIKAELTKDERIDSVDVSVESTTVAGATSFEIAVYAKTGAGPFTLTLRVSAVTVELLRITAES
ncbi:MAG: DUF2634 domain-containing protein [Polyangiaceae bacterium]|nr:DUF2634 domain-containing protein [Polyangiaceae bacterium]